MIASDLISSRVVIPKLISDLDLKEDQMQISSIKEWIAEALEKIGALQQLQRQVVLLPIVDYSAKLPYDLFRLGKLAYSTDGTHYTKLRKSAGVHTPTQATGSDITPIAAFNGVTRTNPSIASEEVLYQVKPGCIQLSEREGYLKVEYYAMPTDDEGMPMMPNAISYIEAVFWYVAMKMTYPKYLRGQIHNSIYSDMKNSWAFYRKQAYSEAMTPDIGDMENIKNVWHKLYPEYNDNDDFFTDINRQQVIYN